MSAGRKSLRIHLVSMSLAACLALPAGFGMASAEEAPSPEQIIKALKPARVTRGVATPEEVARRAEEERLVNTLRNRKTRSLTTDEREQIASIAKTKPSIDIEINFDYDSATIGSKAQSQVTALGQALTSADLRGRTFILAGHTDAKGSDAYNQDLSERRADAIKRYLVDKYGITGSDLVTVGYGKSKLKDPSQPMAEVNRRVQVVNMDNKSTASAK
jgi:outer membrane protein OmpA-like peptidoglycan-associated protein